MNIRVRGAAPADVPAMARIHVATWQETYRGLVRDEVLDDPELPAWARQLYVRRA